MRALKVFSLLLAVVLIAALVVPVTASASQISGWTELLETSSVQSNGNNTFTVAGTSGSVTIPLYATKRLRKIDMLIWNPSGQRFSTAKVTAGGSTLTLEILAIGGNLTRVVGYVPNTTYSSIRVNFTKATSSTQTYEVLSCKVTAVGVQEFVADASVYLESYGTSGDYTTNYNIPLWRDDSAYYSDGAPWLARIQVNDWAKYDVLSVWGSATSASIETIRASINTTALDYEVNFIDAESYEGFIDGDPASSITAEWGKYLFNITIDLTGADRSLVDDPLLVYITGSYDITVQAYFNCQYVNGSIVTADTSEVTWWHRFTSFMTGLFGGESQEADDFKDDAAQKGDEMEDLNNQLQDVTKPPISDIQTDIDGYVDNASQANYGNALSRLTNDSLLISMMAMTLTIALVGYILFGKR